jgi:hypothetical protein
MNNLLRLLQITLFKPCQSTASERVDLRRGKHCFLPLVGAGLLCAAITAQATIVDFMFSGTLTHGRDDANWFQGAFPAGGTFTGEIRYDTSLSSPGTPSPSDPSALQYAFNVDASGPIALSVSGLGGHTFTSTTPFYVNTYDNYGVNPSHPGLTPFDELYYASYDHFNFDRSPLTMDHFFADFGVTFESFILTSTTSIDLPTAPPNLSAFAYSYFNVYVFSNTGNSPLADIEGTITSVTPVPEPGAVGLLSCGLLFLVPKLLWTRRRKLSGCRARNA